MTAVVLLSNGDLVAAGAFETIGGTQASHIARWNGTAWSAMGNGRTLPNTFGFESISTLAVLPNGDLVAAGGFTQICGTPANRIARWNGSTWQPLGGGIGGTSAAVRSLVVLPDGNLLAAGDAMLIGGRSESFAIFNGTSWTALPGGSGGLRDVRAVLRLPNGDLLTGGSTTSTSGTVYSVNRWSGGVWSRVATLTVSSSYRELAVTTISLLPTGEVFVGGAFTAIDGVTYNGMALWSDQGWRQLERGLSKQPSRLLTLPNGEIIISGVSGTLLPDSPTGVVIGDGVTFNPLSPAAGPGLTPLSVHRVVQLPNGDLAAGGEFFDPDSPSNRWPLARFDGARWWKIPYPPTNWVTSMIALPNGHLVVASLYGYSTYSTVGWDGTQWYSLGTDVNGQVSAMAALPNGDLIVGGLFTLAGGVSARNLARWDGTRWSSFGDANGQVDSLAVTPSGDVIAGGLFTAIDGRSVPRLARWNSNGWQPVGGPNLLSGNQPLAIEASTNDNIAVFGAAATFFGAVWRTPSTTLPASVTIENSQAFSCKFGAPLADGTFPVGGQFVANGANRPTFFARLNSGLSPAELNLPPRQVKVWPGEATSLNVPSERNGPVTCIWRKGGVSIDAAITPSANTSRLELPRITARDLGSYDCIIADACGTFVSATFIVSLRNSCSLADVAGRQPVGGDGTVDGTDFIAFFNSFAAGDVLADPVADIAGAGDDGIDPDGTIDATDMIVFINGFSRGC